MRCSLVSGCNVLFGRDAVPMVANCGHLYCADCAAVMVAEKLACACGCLVTDAAPNAVLAEYLVDGVTLALTAATAGADIFAFQQQFELATQPAQAAVTAALHIRESFLVYMTKQRQAALAQFAAIRNALNMAERTFLNEFDCLHEKRDKGIAAHQDACEMTLNVLRSASKMCATAGTAPDAESIQRLLPLLDVKCFTLPDVFDVVFDGERVLEAIRAGVCSIDPLPLDASKCTVTGPGLEAYVCASNKTRQNVFCIVAKGPSTNVLALHPADVVVSIDGPDGVLGTSVVDCCVADGTAVVTYTIPHRRITANISVQIRGVHLGCWRVSRLPGDEV